MTERMDLEVYGESGFQPAKSAQVFFPGLGNAAIGYDRRPDGSVEIVIGVDFSPEVIRVVDAEGHTYNVGL